MLDFAMPQLEWKVLPSFPELIASHGFEAINEGKTMISFGGKIVKSDDSMGTWNSIYKFENNQWSDLLEVTTEMVSIHLVTK